MSTTAQIKTLGDATVDQRARLHDLIAARAVSDRWRRSFYDSVRRAGGLGATAADSAIFYLESLAEAGQQPGDVSRPGTAIASQGAALRSLASSRVLPHQLRALWLGLFDNGQLSYDLADRTILDWQRMPLRDVLAAPLAAAAVASNAPDGYFALLPVGGEQPRCYRIHTVQASRRRVVEQIIDRDPQRRRTVYGVAARQVLTEVARDAAAAARLYARTEGRCSRCNQCLEREDQPGFVHGYGPDCWRDLQRAEAAS